MNLKLKFAHAGTAALFLVVVAGCSSGATPPVTAPTSATAPTSSAASPPSAAGSSASTSGNLAVAETSLGKILVDSNGMTVYYFTKDTANSGKSVCSGGCLAAWPAVVAGSGAPTGVGITAKLGTITRDDGTKQVTVAGMPVYLWAKDKAPGDVTGQGVGKVWYVVAPDGKMVTAAAKS